MKNEPKIIYLNIGADDDFKNLQGVTWSEVFEHSTDIKFVNISEYEKLKEQHDGYKLAFEKQSAKLDELLQVLMRDYLT